jgi:hypothetical protein
MAFTQPFRPPIAVPIKRYNTVKLFESFENCFGHCVNIWRRKQKKLNWDQELRRVFRFTLTPSVRRFSSFIEKIPFIVYRTETKALFIPI